MKQAKPKKRPVDTADFELIASIERCISYCKKHRLPGGNPTSFGKEAIGDHRLLASLYKGRWVKRDTYKRIESFITKHLPRQSDGAAA